MAFWDTPATSGATQTNSGYLPGYHLDRRREKRRMVLRDGVLTPFDSDHVGPRRAVVVDMSDHGVGLRMRETPQVGAMFHLNIPDLQDCPERYIRVVNWRPCKGNQFEVGAEFC